MKDKVSILLSSYTKAYEKSVKGYESGTRTKYRIDIDAKDLYRAVTMEQELEKVMISGIWGHTTNKQNTDLADIIRN